MRIQAVLALISLLLLALAVPASVKAEDVVHHKNGSTTRGMIIEEVPGESVTVRDSVGNTHVILFDDVARIERGLREPGGRKSGVGAFLLSFLVFPGTGQFYNGELGKGGVMMGMAAGAIAIVASTDIRSMEVTASSVLLGDWIWSAIDAPISSSRINRERGYSDAPRNAVRLVVAHVAF